MEIRNGAFHLSKPALRALVTFSSGDETRPHLNGVTFEPSKGRAYATDGHRAIIVQARSDTVGGGNASVIPREALEQAIRACGKGCHVGIRVPGAPGDHDAPGSALAPPSDLASVDVLDEADRQVAGLHARVPDVKPVPVDAVVPQLDAAVMPRTPFFGIAAQYFADVKLLGAAIGDRLGVECWPPSNALDPVLFRAESDDGAEWTAVVMPVRTGRDAIPVTADRAVAWAADVVADERKQDATAIRASFARALNNVPALPAPATPPKPDKAPATRRRRSKSKAKA